MKPRWQSVPPKREDTQEHFPDFFPGAQWRVLAYRVGKSTLAIMAALIMNSVRSAAPYHAPGIQ